MSAVLGKPIDERGRGLTRRVGRAAMAAVEFFAPRICHVCLERLEPDDEVICDLCRGELRPVAAPICPRCGHGWAELTDDGSGCKACPATIHFTAARGAVRFSGVSHDLVHELKFYGHVELAPVMARLCVRTLEDEWAFETPDAIVPVPLHESRWRQRGFNQSEEIGKELERITGIPLWPEALERIRPTKAQSRLTTEEREANVRDAFYSDRASGVRDKTIVLLDDVMTSSATVNECSRALKAAGARRVLVLVFAHAATGRK